MASGPSHNGRWQALGAIAVVVVTVFSLLGLNAAVGALEGRVLELESVSEQIAETQEAIAVLELELVEVRRDAAELARLRNDILSAVCAANARSVRDLRDCYAAVDGREAPGPMFR